MSGGQHLHGSQSASRCFITTTLPRIGSSTHIVAATHPPEAQAAPETDGWFVADFYAFNYLLHGLGASQTWLCLTDPQAIVSKYGPYSHGSPVEDRKVVLSQELLEDDKALTPVTVVQTPHNIVDQFLKAVRLTTTKAKQEKGSILLLLFFHGVDQEYFALDCTGKAILSMTMLRGVLEPGVPVRLLTTACFSGGWMVYPEIHITKTIAADSDDVSKDVSKDMLPFWPQSTSLGQTLSGSIFVSSITETVTKPTSELPSKTKNNGQNKKVQHLVNMQPDPEAPGQVAVYNSLCRSIWDSCRGMYRLWDDHTLKFSAQGDSWDEIWSTTSAMSLVDYYKARWGRLPSVDAEKRPTRTGAVENDIVIGPLIQSIYKNRISEMVKLWQHHACPGETVQGYGHKLNALMNHCIKTGSPTQTGVDVDHDDPASLWNIVAIIQYRLNMAFLAESILDAVHLPRPRGQSCLLWDRYRWQDEMTNTLNIGHPELRRQVGLVWDYFLKAGLISAAKPTAEQGPVFNRFLQYIAAAVVQAQKPDEDRLSDMAIIVQRLMSTAKFYEEAALNNPNVKRCKLGWLQSLGQAGTSSIV